MPPARLEVAGLTAGHGPTRVVEDAAFAVPPGGRLAVLGRNGVGKTTLLMALIGHARHHAGTIRLDGTDLAPLPTAERARAGLGYVPQTRDVFRSLTVAENLFVGLNGRPRTNLDEAYALFPRLAERRTNLAAQLSGGEQQMLSVARAILGAPRLLLLDEPLEGLAPVICDTLMAAFTQLTSRMTIILVEQQVARALAFADDALLLERGRIAWHGPPAALRADPALIERYVGVGAAH